jgi:hypothetical protein
MTGIGEASSTIIHSNSDVEVEYIDCKVLIKLELSLQQGIITDNILFYYGTVNRNSVSGGVISQVVFPNVVDVWVNVIPHNVARLEITVAPLIPSYIGFQIKTE